jgi:hypothetical protein
MKKPDLVLVPRSDLAAVVAYLYDDERHHYFESDLEDREDHIFTHIQKLSEALFSNERQVL